MKPASFIILIVPFIIISGCTAPFSFDDKSLLPYEVSNTTVLYTFGGANYISLPQNGGNYSIHSETLHRGYSTAVGYQYSTAMINGDRFGNTVTYIKHGWVSPTTSEGYLGYSDENSILNSTFTIPPNSKDPTIVIFCKRSDGVDVVQPCPTDISISRLI